MTTREVLERAYDLLFTPYAYTTATGAKRTAYHWTKGTEHRTVPLSNGDKIDKYCSIGAIRKVTTVVVEGKRPQHDIRKRAAAERFLAEVIGKNPEGHPNHVSIVSWNDHCSRTLNEVREKFQEAIKLAIQDEERA